MRVTWPRFILLTRRPPRPRQTNCAPRSRNEILLFCMELITVDTQPRSYKYTRMPGAATITQLNRSYLMARAAASASRRSVHHN